MANQPSGLSTSDEIIEAANCLTSFADAADAKIREDFDSGAMSQVQAFEGFNAVARIRSLANTLYTAAVKSVVKDLAMPQKELLALFARSEKVLAQVNRFRVFIDLIADVVVLATAIYAGKPAPIVSALKEINKDVDEIRAA